MDLIIKFFKAAWFIIPLLILFYVLKSSWAKGLIGETIVSLANKYLLSKDEYYMMNNITLKIENETTQIDHIIVSSFGVFVIETKNMNGWIFGNEKQKNWTQKIYKNNFIFQNPLRQNYKHIKSIETITEIDIKHIHSVVVFINGKLKTDMPDNVKSGLDYINYIKQFQTPFLSGAQINHIVSKIKEHSMPKGFKTNREHVKQLKERHNDK